MLPRVTLECVTLGRAVRQCPVIQAGEFLPDAGLITADPWIEGMCIISLTARAMFARYER